MLYWVYEEIENKSEGNVEFFNGLTKTEVYDSREEKYYVKRS